VKIIRFITLSCFLLPYFAWGQTSDVLLLAKAKKNSILLRWAPTDPNQWQTANKSGYVIERYTITRGKQILRPPSKIILSPALKPRPLVEWERPSENNDYVAIAAEALYGSDFEVGPLQATPFDVVNRSRQLEQRFSFALLAADHSFETALLSGLGWVDAQVKPDEKYLYRIHVANADSANSVPATFYISLADTIQVLPPAELRAQFGDKQVMLTWPKTAVEKTFTSYIIERKQAGEPDFKKVNNAPFLNPGNEEDPYFRYIDSLSSTGSEVAYRIRGITAFGEISPASAEAKGISIPALKAIVSSFSVQPTKESEAWLRWQISGDKKQIRSVKIERGSRESGPYFTVHRMSVNETEWRDKKPLATAYYRIKLMGERDSTATFPHLLQLYDSVPPLAPQGLRYEVSSSGVITLQWGANSENDLQGYEVYRSNFQNAEFSKISKELSSISQYRDSLKTQSLDGRIYYRLKALDNRFNASIFSEILTVVLPDKIPPVPPSIKNVKNTEHGVELSWFPSSSKDAAGYLIERRTLGGTNLSKLANLPDSIFHFVDSTGVLGSQLYSVKSYDRSGNISEGSTIQLTVKERVKQSAQVLLKATVDRDKKQILLEWDQIPGAVKTIIYRSEGDDQPFTIKTINSSRQFMDSNVKIESSYKYHILVVNQNGASVGKSLEISVKY
jgi:fibronectin type 3 domain-containing protein